LQAVQRPGRRYSIQLIAIFLAAAAIPIVAARTTAQAPAQPAPQQQQPPPAAASPQEPAPAAPANPPPAPPVVPPQRPAFVVILDPGHGGADNGARGASGVVEKDVALALARATRLQLQQHGLRVLLTRDSDEDPSFDDRATLANAQLSSLLVSFHVSSTGKVGSVRTYYYTFAPAIASSPSPGKTGASPARSAAHLVPWDRAQENFAESSRHLADLIQAELVKNFPGSPAQSSAVAVRDLRSVAAPAVSIELSSVAVADRGALEAMFTPLAASVARGIVAYHSASDSGAH
jgi:N-acetylmuramoyl-L-alanine amidase